MRADQVVADDIGVAVLDLGQPRVLKPRDRGAQLGRHRPDRIRIAEQLAEHLFAGADRTTRALARDAASTQRLIRTRRQPEGLGDRDAAAAMWYAHALVEHERLVARCVDVCALVR